MDSHASRYSAVAWARGAVLLAAQRRLGVGEAGVGAVVAVALGSSRNVPLAD